MSKVFIFGSTGMLGTYLTKYFKEKYRVYPISRDQLDIGKSSELQIFNYIVGGLTIESNDVIINASGIIKQRNYDTSELIKVNSLFPQILARIKDQVGCNVIHITTDCVFSGLEGNYTENHVHDCLDDYGKSKSLGENNKLTIIRTSIIGEENFNKKSLIEWVKSQHSQSVNGYTNHLWNGVTCLELAHLIEKIIVEKTYWNGVRHVFSPEIVNKSQLLSMINETYKLNLTITDIDVNLCDRSLSTIYNSLIDKPLSQQIREQANFSIN